MAVYDNEEKRQRLNSRLRKAAGLDKEEEEAATESSRKERLRAKAAGAAELAKEEAKDYAEDYTREQFDNFVRGELDERRALPGGRKGDFARGFDRLIKPRKRMLLFNTIGFLIFAIVSFLIIAFTSGPLQFVHFAKYLERTHFYVNHYFLDFRLGQAIVNSHYAKNGHTERRNLSYIGNQLADKYDTRLKNAGITLEHDNTFRLRAMTIDPNTSEGRQAMQKMREKGVDVDAIEPNQDGRIRIDLDRNDLGTNATRFRRHAISGVVKTLNMDSVSAAMASRLLKLRGAVDFHPLKNVVRSADEDANAYLKRVKDDIKKRIKYGVDYSARAEARASGGQDADGNEVGPSEQTSQASEAANELLEDVDQNASNAEKAGAIRGKLTGGYGVVGVVSMVCAVQKVGDAAAEMSYFNVNLPLIRTGMMATTVGSQVQSGEDFNHDELSVHADFLYDEAEGTSWVDAKPIQANMNNPQTGVDIPEAAQPITGDEKPAFFATIDGFITKVPGGQAFCNAVTTTIGGWVLTGIGIGLTATGPISAILNAGSELLQEIIVGTFLDDLVAWLASDQVDLDVEGAVFGAYADYGAALAANDSAISYGGTELTDGEWDTLKEEQNVALQQENEHKSFYARYLDPYNYDSLASTALMSYAYPVNTSNVSSIVTAPLNIISKLFTSFGNLLTPNIHADTDYDYGFQRYGFNMSEIDDPDYANPYANEEIVEEYGIEKLNEEYGKPCFNTIIDPETYQLQTTSENDGPAAKRYDQIDEKCKDRSNEMLTRYRFYLADTTVSLSAACYENIEIPDRDPCTEIGLTNTTIGGSTSAGNNGDSPPAGGTGFAWPIEQDDWPTRSQPIAECGLRYKDGSVHTGIDISVPTGTPVYAAASGRISMSNPSYGALNIETNETDPSGKKLYVNYQHLSERVRDVDDVVAKGQLIGYSGATGTEAAHLHFSIWTTNRFLSGHMSPDSPSGLETLSQMRHPMDYLPEDSRNTSECSR